MKLYDCRRAARKRFDLEKGYQPICSLFYLFSGAFTYITEGECRTVKAGEAVAFSPDVYFERKMNAPIDFLYLRVTLEEGETFPTGILPIQNRERLIDDLNLLMNQPSGTESKHLLRDIFLIALKAEKPQVQGSVLAQRAKNCIDQSIAKHITLDALANTLAVSRATLTAHFRRAFGMSIIEYQTHLRLKEAKRALADTDLPICEVASLVGFECPYYFSNVFRRHVGLSPSAYRKQERI